MLRSFAFCRQQTIKIVKIKELCSNYSACFQLCYFSNSNSVCRTVCAERKSEPFSIEQSCVYAPVYSCSLLKQILFTPLFKRKRSSVPHAIGQTLNKNDQDFIAVFSDIIRDLNEICEETGLPDLTKWYSEVLQYNVPDGKFTKGLELIEIYRLLSPLEALTQENTRGAQIMGWCLEMFQAFVLILNDMINRAEQRQGKMCWYRCPDVGVNSVNDAISIESAIYQLLRKYFSDKPYYTQTLDLFRDITHDLTMGQALDFLTAQSFEKYKFEKFTMEQFNTIAKYKTTLHLPIILGMYMAGIRNADKRIQDKTMLLEIAYLQQVQDDYIDCFGDSALSGKIGTDIREGKCTWLAVMALQRCTPEQKKIMEDCYRSDDPAKVDAVINVYLQLSLPELFKSYEEDAYNAITRQIKELPADIEHEIFFNMVNQMRRRTS